MTTCREFFTFSWPLRGRGRGGRPKRSAWPFFSRFFFWRLPLSVSEILQYEWKPCNFMVGTQRYLVSAFNLEMVIIFITLISDRTEIPGKKLVEIPPVIVLQQPGRGWLAFGDCKRIPQSFRRVRIFKFAIVKLRKLYESRMTFVESSTKAFQKASKSRQYKVSRQNSVCWGSFLS